VHAELSRRQSKDEPPFTRVNVRPTEHVAERCSKRLRFRRVELDVRTDDPHGHLRLRISRS
jgi:hypothetical protein